MIDNIKSQMRKGMLEYCILEVIHSREVYATEILEELKSANLLVVEGTLYPLLTRMKNAGLLNYRWQESTSGPPRKYFCITEEGAALLAELEKEWAAITDAVSIITSKDNIPLINEQI